MRAAVRRLVLGAEKRKTATDAVAGISPITPTKKAPLDDCVDYGAGVVGDILPDTLRTLARLSPPRAGRIAGSTWRKCQDALGLRESRVRGGTPRRLQERTA
jgi:hypothetical protein